MAQVKRHFSVLSDSLVRHIEYVLPKLKYSVYVNSIRNWLENFEKDEVDLALDFLFHLEYIPFSELQSRLSDQLQRIVREVDTDILLIPYAAYPKSNDVIMYLITKLEVYKKNKKRIFYTKDIYNYSFKQLTTLVYVDDFIGSGKSFDKWYTKNKISEQLISKELVSDRQIILAALAMDEGVLFLNGKYENIRVYAELRHKVFSEAHSPFNIMDTRVLMKSLCMKYGVSIQVGFERPTNKIFMPLGYEESEALVAFDYGTPNNTLSIIWGDHNWAPIFPRSSKSRIRNAKKMKETIDFYLGVMNKIGFEIVGDIEIKVGRRKILYSKKEDYSTLTLVFLKEKKYHDIMICQLLGVTMSELSNIYKSCRRKKLTDKDNQLTKLAIDYITILKKEGMKYKSRENALLDKTKEPIFVPTSFEGKT